METQTIQNTPAQSATRSGLGLVLAGGLTAGALDLTFAFLFYWPQGATPLRILQFIASGVLGIVIAYAVSRAVNRGATHDRC
jgi:hypothetical protein